MRTNILETVKRNYRIAYFLVTAVHHVEITSINDVIYNSCVIMSNFRIVYLYKIVQKRLL